MKRFSILFVSFFYYSVLLAGISDDFKWLKRKKVFGTFLIWFELREIFWNNYKFVAER